MVKRNACVFISGEGSNLRNLLKRSRDYNFPVSIKLVISNNPNAKGVNFTKKYSIPYLIVNTKVRNFENIILAYLKRYRINIICLAGYMRIISKKFLRSFGKNVINIHPSLLPKFKGLNTFKRILEERKYYRIGSFSPISLNLRIVASSHKNSDPLNRIIRKDLLKQFLLLKEK